MLKAEVMWCAWNPCGTTGVLEGCPEVEREKYCDVIIDLIKAQEEDYRFVLRCLHTHSDEVLHEAAAQDGWNHQGFMMFEEHCSK